MDAGVIATAPTNEIVATPVITVCEVMAGALKDIAGAATSTNCRTPSTVTTATGALIGMSDSAVVTVIAPKPIEALGPERVV